jgi:integrase/recombinase XerD
MTDQLPTTIPPARVSRMLTAAEFQELADVPPEFEWFANITNAGTRRVYEKATKDFMRFVGIVKPEEFRIVTPAHIIAWRDELMARGLAGVTIRRHLATLSSLFKHLCDKHAIKYNPAKDVQRPKAESGEGKTPAIADHQARKLLDAPDETRPNLLRQGRLSDADDSTRNKRDRAILSTLLFHALRCDELCKIKVRDFKHVRKGVPYIKVHGKGGKIRYVELHPGTNATILEYLDAAGHGADENGALFRPLRNRKTGELANAITSNGVHKLVKAYSKQLGFEIGPHALRATAATNALDHNADIKKVKDWLGHAHISTTEIYDRRRSRPEDSPTFKVSY